MCSICSYLCDIRPSTDVTSSLWLKILERETSHPCTYTPQILISHLTFFHFLGGSGQRDAGVLVGRDTKVFEFVKLLLRP